MAGWSLVPSPTTQNLNGVWFADANTGVCVGDSGAVARSTDGGMSFVDTSIPAGTNLQGVHFAPDVVGVPSYENFESFTEVDPSGILTVNPNGSRYEALVDGDSSDAADTYLYVDYGTGHFDDTVGFEHLFEFELSPNAPAKNWECPWVVSNDVDQYLNLNSGYSICMWEQNAGGGSPFVEIYNNNIPEVATIGLDSAYLSPASIYGKVTVVPGGNVTAEFFSDAARTTSIGTIAVAASALSYRYLYGLETDTRAGWVYRNSLYSRN
ncbi:MAG: hypothetical protein ABFQ82_01135, partial [Thermodesulfobacteriota bacterium]